MSNVIRVNFETGQRITDQPLNDTVEYLPRSYEPAGINIFDCDNLANEMLKAEFTKDLASKNPDSRNATLEMFPELDTNNFLKDWLTDSDWSCIKSAIDQGEDSPHYISTQKALAFKIRFFMEDNPDMPA